MRLRRWAVNRVRAITLGADPEFELVKDGRVVDASRVFKGGARMPWGIIGYDGAGAPLELRPNPSTSPSKLVENVGRLLLSVPKVVGGFPSTMGEMYAIGGHVHIGIRGMGVPYERVVKTIDDAVGDILYQMNTRVRLNSPYGKRCDWRSQAWGVEYRTPPATMWAHPEAALAFLRAIKRATKLALEGREYTPDDDWYKVRYALSGAAMLVMQHNGRIHWEAWKEYVRERAGEDAEREIEEAAAASTEKRCEVRIGIPVGGHRGNDGKFIGDISALLGRLGIRYATVVVLAPSRGDYASNVRGYGVYQYDHGPYAGEEHAWAQPLMLSWRFCNDPEFRREELPKLEAALASTLGRGGKVSDNRIVKEVIRLQVDWPDGDEEEGDAVELEAVETDPHAIFCSVCESEVSSGEAIYVGEGVYCEECFHEEYGTCVACEELVRLGDANHVYGNVYCDDCYYERFTVCEACGENIELDGAHVVSGLSYCGGCYNRRFVECDECGGPVSRRDVNRGPDGGRYCDDCHDRLFVECEMCEATIRRDEAVIARGEALCEGCYSRAREEESVEA